MTPELTDHQSVISWIKEELNSHSGEEWRKIAMTYLRADYAQDFLLSAYQILDNYLKAHLHLSDEEYDPIWESVADYMDILWWSFTQETIDKIKGKHV